MKKEIYLTSLLAEAKDSLFSVRKLSNEAITEILPLVSPLCDWLNEVRGEARDRAADGAHFRGYVLLKSCRRKISDQEGALAALEREDPALVPACQETRLKGVRELLVILGRERFKRVIVPFTKRVRFCHLEPDRMNG